MINIITIGEIRRSLRARNSWSVADLNDYFSQFGITFSEPISVHQPSAEELFKELETISEIHERNKLRGSPHVADTVNRISKHRITYSCKANRIAKRRKKNKNKKTHRR